MSLDWVLIRRRGCAWALPGSHVAEIRAAASGFTLDLGSAEISADAVLATPAHLTIIPAGPVLRSFAPSGCAGLTVWKEEPVVVVDPDNPPGTLSEDRGELSQSEDRGDGD